MNSDGDILKATNNAAYLAAELCRRYKLSTGNIMQHNHWSGKNCPQLIRSGKPYDWSVFIETVKKNIEQEDDIITQEEFEKMYETMISKQYGDNPSEWAKEATDAAKKSGAFIGDGNGNFNWQTPVSKEALATVLYRLGLLVVSENSTKKKIVL